LVLEVRGVTLLVLLVARAVIQFLILQPRLVAGVVDFQPQLLVVLAVEPLHHSQVRQETKAHFHPQKAQTEEAVAL
jgi:hypothetical protein